MARYGLETPNRGAMKKGLQEGEKFPMRTLNYELDIQKDRTIRIQLPHDISPGKHQIVLIIDENETSPEENIDEFQRLLHATEGIWRQGDGLVYQESMRDQW